MCGIEPLIRDRPVSSTDIKRTTNTYGTATHKRGKGQTTTIIYSSQSHLLEHVYGNTIRIFILIVLCTTYVNIKTIYICLTGGVWVSSLFRGSGN